MMKEKEPCMEFRSLSNSFDLKNIFIRKHILLININELKGRTTSG
jgi:hypothetical protein